MKRLVIRFFFLATLSLLWACAPGRPSGILSEEKMTDVLIDIHLAQGMAEAQGKSLEITRYKYIQAVFQKHRITEAEFDSSMVYYSGRSEKFALIYNNVVNRVQIQAERIGVESTDKQDKYATLTNEGDTANIWLGKNFVCIIANPVQCTYSFHMKADSTFKAGDSFLWRFKSQYVARSMNNEAIAMLNFHYDTDTITAVTELISGKSEYELRHTPGKDLEKLNLLSISGHIYLPLPNNADKPKPLLISDMQLIRMHKRIEEKVIPKADTIRVDSISADTLPQQKAERLTPLQMRESQPKEKKIHVTKESLKPIKPNQTIPARTNRRR